MDFSFSELNINSVVTDNVAMLPSIENLPGYEAGATPRCRPTATDDYRVSASLAKRFATAASSAWTIAPSCFF